MSENILEVKGLTKDYGDFVLDKLTFTVPKGVIMGLIGENGAGKSTTINCILNEISKTDGNIEIFGKDYLSEEIEIKDKIGVVFDENHFPDIFTPNEIGTYMSGIYSKWERNTYVNYLSKFELPADRDIYLAALHRQAAARSHGPALLWFPPVQRLVSGGGPDCCPFGTPDLIAFEIQYPPFHRNSHRKKRTAFHRSCPGSRCSPAPFSALT